MYRKSLKEKYFTNIAQHNINKDKKQITKKRKKLQKASNFQNKILFQYMAQDNLNLDQKINKAIKVKKSVDI